MSKLAVSELNPAVAVASESPLHGAQVRVTTVRDANAAGIVVREQPFLGHLVLRGNAAEAEFAAGVKQALGLALPVEPCALHVDEARGRSIQWSSPDEWLIIVPAGDEYATELRLRDALSGHFAVVNVSGGQTVLTLTGPAVREMLMKSTPYDVHPRQFPVGKAVATVFAKAAAVIRRPAEDRWELVIRRSFADYLFRWVLDASEEFGVHVAS